MDASDLRHKIQANEYEFNPFLLSDPDFQALRAFEIKHEIINMNYGVLTVLNGKLPTATTSALLETLKAQSKTTGLSSAELLLSWANDRLDGVVVSSTSRSDRAVETVALFLSDHPTRLADGVYDQIEQAAARDGFEGKVFYKHRHMEAVVAA